MSIHWATRYKIIRMYRYGFKLYGIEKDTGLDKVVIFNVLAKAGLVDKERPELYR